jgi:outer membrane receptor protein involved in Fe transport
VNATTTQATWESLGSPSYIVPVFSNGTTTYRYKVRDSIMTNAYVSYRVQTKNKWTNDTTIRVGVVNLFDRVPPLSSDSRGYETSVYNLMARGLSWSVQLTKKL